MAGIDPSIALNAGRPAPPAPFNALATAGQVAQTGNMLLQGRQLQMQMAGRQALQQAYQGIPTDPRTGLPDTSQLINRLLQTPGGSYVLPDVIKSAQAQQEMQYKLNQAQLAQTVGRTNAVNGALAPLMRMGANVTPQDVFGALSGLKAAGFPLDEAAGDIAATFPGRQPGQSDQQYGTQIQSWLTNHAARTWDPATQATQFTPRVAYQNVGGQMQPVDMNSQTNPGLADSGPLQLGLTPAEKTDQVKAPPGPNGEPRVQSRAAYAQGNGLGNLVQGQGGGQGGGQTSAFGANGGRLPGALLNPNRAAITQSTSSGSTQPAPTPTSGYLSQPAAAPGQPPPAQPGPMTVGLGPAQQSALTAQGTQGQDAAGALFSAAQDSPSRQAQISAMLGDLTKYGSGPNSPLWQSVRGRMVQLGVAPDSWIEGVAAQENFTKMANQFIAKQASTMGPVTNDKLALAGESGPNPIFTTLGNQGLLHVAQGNEDALNIKSRAWAQAQLPQAQGGQGLTGADFQNWSTQFNQGFSPSAFWYSRLAPVERQTLIAGMSPDQQQSLHGAIVDGINRGWINPALLTQPAAGTTAAPADPSVTPAQPPPAATPSAPPAAPASVSPPAAMPISASPSLAVDGNGQPAMRGY